MMQGMGGLHVVTTGSSRRSLSVRSVEGQVITGFARANAALSTVSLQETPTILYVMKTGVRINGKPWTIGTPCLFDDNQFGIVTRMTYWQDTFETTLILELHRYRMRGDNIQGWVAKSPDMPTEHIFWNQLTHRCKVYPKKRMGVTVQAVVRVSTTRPSMDGMDFDNHML